MSFRRFHRLGLASALSPRFLPLLAEARRLGERIEAEVHVLHAGVVDADKQQIFDKAFRSLGYAEPPALHVSGGGPVGVLVEAANHLNIDLLMLGALEKEAGGRNFLGNVARSLLREADFSLAMFTRPQLEATRFRNIVVVCDFSELAREALQWAMRLGDQDQAASIYVATLVTVFDQMRMGGENQRATIENVEQSLEEFVKSVGDCHADVTVRCIEGTTGFAMCDFVESVKADLLVIPSAGPGGAEILPHGMDWLLHTIPTNLLVLRPERTRD